MHSQRTLTEKGDLLNVHITIPRGWQPRKKERGKGGKPAGSQHCLPLLPPSPNTETWPASSLSHCRVFLATMTVVPSKYDQINSPFCKSFLCHGSKTPCPRESRSLCCSSLYWPQPSFFHLTWSDVLQQLELQNRMLERLPVFLSTLAYFQISQTVGRPLPRCHLITHTNCTHHHYQ